MKILLVYPQYIYHDTFDARSPSLSLLYLASILEKDGHQVKIFNTSEGPITQVKNGYLYGISNEEISRALQGKDYDLVGITCSFASRWRFVSEQAALFKKLWPGTPIVVGGLFPTYEWEYCFRKSKDIDAIVLGEGEGTLAGVAAKLEDGCSIANACGSVDGIVWRDGEKINKKDKSGYNEDLNSLPFPAWHLLDLKSFFNTQRNLYELRPPYFTVLSSRSCPEACSFCNMFITHGRKWRTRSPENFVDELEFLMVEFNVNSFFIADDNFSFDLERAKNICREIIKRNLKIHYNTGNGLNIKRIDNELIKLMKASGCGSIALAIESGSERIRNDVYKKKLSTEKIYQVLNWCYEVGIPSIGFFMVGAPGENRESVEDTKKLIQDLPLTLCTCSIYTPYPKTRLYDMCVELGYLKEIDPENETRVEFVTSMLSTPDFLPEDVKAWQKEIYFHFMKHKWPQLLKELFKPNGIVNFSNFSILKRLLNIKKLPFKLT